MSFSQPSQVSATTGSDHQSSSGPGLPCATRHWMTASRTTPTLCVLVIITGPSRNPDSSTQVVPVISPLPFCANQAANTGSEIESSTARQDGRDAGAHGTPADFQLAGPRDERGVADQDARDVGDGVERSRSAVEGNAEIARTRLRQSAGRSRRSRFASGRNWRHARQGYERAEQDATQSSEAHGSLP